MSARQFLKRLVIATSNPLPRTKIWHRPTEIGRTINYIVALSNLQEDPNGGWAVALPARCPNGGLQSDATGSCWLASGSRLPCLLHREPTLRFPCTKQLAAIFVYGIPLSDQDGLFAYPSPCCAVNDIRELSSLKYGFYVPCVFFPWCVFVTCVVSPPTVTRDNLG